MISKVYRSLSHMLSLFSASCVFTSRSLATASNSGDSSTSCAEALSERRLPSNCLFSSQTLLSLSLSLMLRPTVSPQICLGIKHPSGAYDQIFITVRELQACWFGARSLWTGRICRLQLLLVRTSAVIFGSESRRTRGHILLSQIRDFVFRRLLRLADLRWRYSTPPLHGCDSVAPVVFLITSLHGPSRKHCFQQYLSVACVSVAWKRMLFQSRLLATAVSLAPEFLLLANIPQY
jgi:hypothetical protein